MLETKIGIYVVFFFYYVLVKKLLEMFYPEASNIVKTFILIILPFLLKYVYKYIYNFLYFTKEERNLYRLYSQLNETDFIQFVKKTYNNNVKHLESLKCPTGETILAYAIHDNKSLIVEELLKMGYNVDNKNIKNNERAIFRAIHWNKVEILKLLLKYKPNLYELNSLKLSPIELAIYRGKDVIVDLLLREGVEYSFSHYENSKLKSVIKWEEIKRKVKNVLATHIGKIYFY